MRRLRFLKSAYRCSRCFEQASVPAAMLSACRELWHDITSNKRPS